MKKIVLTIIAILGLVTASATMADPSIVVIDFTCPVTTGAGLHTLSNFGSRITGYGTETIDGHPAFNSPLFSFQIPNSATIPNSLATYTSSGTNYDSTTALISCSYTSSGAFTPFTVLYEMTNGNGGQIVTATPSTITINQFLGFKKG